MEARRLLETLVYLRKAEGSRVGSGKLYVGEHAPYSSQSQKLAISTLRRLLTPRANMNAPIRDAFDCSSRKPMRTQFASGFPELFKRRALGSRSELTMNDVNILTKIR